MLILRGASSDAEHAFLQAAKIRQLDPRAQFSLAIAAALQGQENRARSLGISAISLLPLEERNQALELLNTSIDQGLKSFPYVDRSLNNDR
jgi:Flp pilus assembly protein TadD